MKILLAEPQKLKEYHAHCLPFELLKFSAYHKQKAKNEVEEFVEHKFVREAAKSKTDPTKYYELL